MTREMGNVWRRMAFELVFALFIVGVFLFLVWVVRPEAQTPRRVMFPRPPNPSHIQRPSGHRDDGFAFCVLHFESDRMEPDGMGWATDYPLAGRHLLMRLPEITTTRATEDQWVVSVTDDRMFECPMLFASDVGTLSLSDDQAQRLTNYLLKGGMLWVDDFWGSQSWDQWLRELGKLSMVMDIETPTLAHPVYWVHYHVNGAPQVSNRARWKSTGTVSERGADSPVTPLRVVVDAEGRIVVVMTHNTDIFDTWERETDPDYFAAFAALGYSVGVNVVLCGMMPCE